MDRDRTDSLRRQILDRHWTDYVLRLDFMSMSRQPLVTSTDDRFGDQKSQWNCVILDIIQSSRMEEASDVTSASRSDFRRQCREWASSLDNAILRLNFKPKRGGDEFDSAKRPICCGRCGASGRVRFSIVTRTAEALNAKGPSLNDVRKIFG